MSTETRTIRGFELKQAQSGIYTATKRVKNNEEYPKYAFWGPDVNAIIGKIGQWKPMSDATFVVRDGMYGGGDRIVRVAWYTMRHPEEIPTGMLAVGTFEGEDFIPKEGKATLHIGNRHFRGRYMVFEQKSCEEAYPIIAHVEFQDFEEVDASLLL